MYRLSRSASQGMEQGGYGSEQTQRISSRVLPFLFFSIPSYTLGITLMFLTQGKHSLSLTGTVFSAFTLPPGTTASVQRREQRRKLN